MLIGAIPPLVTFSVSYLVIAGGGGGGEGATSGYYLYRSDAKMYGKYLGLTLTGTTVPFTINGFQLEHELRARF